MDPKTHQDHVWGAAFHPLDNNLIVTHGRGLLSVWTRRKDGIFTRTDLFKVRLGFFQNKLPMYSSYQNKG